MPEDVVQRRLASVLIDHVGMIGVTVLVYRLGQNAEYGWELQAWDENSGERWRLEGDQVYPLACELAGLVGIDLTDS